MASLKGRFVKGEHPSIKTEFKKGIRYSSKTEFGKGSIPWGFKGIPRDERRVSLRLN